MSAKYYQPKVVSALNSDFQLIFPPIIKGKGAFDSYQAFLDAVTRFFKLGTSYLLDQT